MPVKMCLYVVAANKNNFNNPPITGEQAWHYFAEWTSDSSDFLMTGIYYRVAFLWNSTNPGLVNSLHFDSWATRHLGFDPQAFLPLQT